MSNTIRALASTIRPAIRPVEDRFLVVKDVQKTFASSRGLITALKDIDLTLETGEFVSIVGPSGCGKSTLLKCIAGLEEITSGEIRVGNVPVKRHPPDGLGVVFQRDVLFDWRTIIDNVLVTAEFLRLPRRKFIERARQLLEIYGLAGYETRYPWELSGGMRQRVAICRALLCDPKFVLMDEPFGALDALTRDELNLELQNRWNADKKTILFVTHSIAEAVFLSDRVVVMDRNPGRIVVDISIELPRPRPLSIRDSNAFTAYSAEIRKVMTKAK